MRDYFGGWYFRCQSKEHTVALIPAVHIAKGARSGSIQLISDEGNWNAALRPQEGLSVHADRPCATLGNSVFREDGICLNFHTDSLCAIGELRFDALSPIRYDIMGPFRYVPFMECRHSVASMRHTVNGSLHINGKKYCFHNGTGYIEGDRGRSFPKQYAWTQCFFPGGSLMLSVAEIPLGPLRFTGVISVIQTHGKEYRLSTYLGAKATKIGDGEVTIRQGGLMLTAKLLEKNAYPLRAPVSGAMTRMIRENVACHTQYRFSKNNQTILAFETKSAAFEYEYP